ncbi:hypothetical protein VMCG_03308 [Cytospora schulzeri]|uniref:RTA1 like protein n=1 Tax=Cytospora schulzeri TaxID=448051 RepID=A0A423WXK0_9PEZI|nr:hypothetical protein VMCG_03308 [Valsa malicola]
MAQILPYKGDYYLWNYVPSLPGAIVFIVLFAIATAVHGWRMFRHRVWFHIPLVLGCLIETVGYVAYTLAHWHTNKLAPYIIQSIFILVSPPLIAATIYMILGRLIVRLPSGPKCSIVRPSWLTKAFILGDVQSFLIQASGGGLMTSKGQKKMGQIVIVSGLIMQIVTFGIFLVAAIVFHIRYGRLAATGSRGRRRAEAGIPWTKVLWMLYAVSAVIMVRSLFRTVEYIQGHQGYNLTNQWTFFVFDSALMFLSTVLFFVMYHPDDLNRTGGEDGYIETGTASSVEMAPSNVERAIPRK